jgi:hypothetical protein
MTGRSQQNSSVLSVTYFFVLFFICVILTNHQVLRQGSFVRKMAELGWTEPAFLSDGDGAIILEHCVTRYHAYAHTPANSRIHSHHSISFLNLMTGSPASFFVPTLDIDLAWHTHQLMGAIYQRDCKAVVGRYVDQ